MKTPLTPLQRLVAEHYCGGEFAHIETQEEAEDCGDTLFSFVIREAGDAGGAPDYVGMLDTAINQLRSLQAEMEDL